jgi:hypothetical protein
MMKTSLKNVSPLRKLGLFLGTVLVATAFAGLLVGQSPDADGKHGLVGTWMVTGNGLGITFQAINTYNVDGTSLAHDNSAAPSIETITQGPWKKKGPATFVWEPQNFFFDSSGNFGGTVKSKMEITLTGPNGFTSSGESKFYDANGNLLGTSPLTETGTRLVAN